jgi:NAD-dependent SIR2 family protein deacetylase
MKANEYLDDPEVLGAKVDLFIAMLKASKHCIAYTGAGISRSAGIPDYASKAAASLSNTAKRLDDPSLARPTLAHRVMVALYKKGSLKYWVQQNHDGLPQMAGFPEAKLNAIHGDWFDISNPVVQFSGSLRGDLFHDMLKHEKREDLCICLGTSLSGMVCLRH